MITESTNEIREIDLTMADKRPTPIIRDTDELLRRAIEAIEYNRIDEAVGLMRQAAQIAPDSHDIQLVLGLALMRAMEMGEAIAAFEAAIVLEPSSFFAHFRLGEAYLRVGVPIRARETLDRALQLSSSPEHRAMVRTIMSLEAKRSLGRVWRPDFSKILRRGKPE
jgi:tetratricopeptide (TPR) repeat protein